MALKQKTQPAKSQQLQPPVAAVRAPIRTRKHKPRVFHVLSAIARPVSGAKLFAHTLAALRTLGMTAKGYPSVPRSAIIAFMGERAVNHHIDKKGTLNEADGRVRLNEAGAEFFENRVVKSHADGLVLAYQRLFNEGIADPELEVRTDQISTVLVEA